MCYKMFLRKLAKNEIKWTADNLKAVKRLGEEGFAEYKTQTHAGWWKITGEGRKYAGV